MTNNSDSNNSPLDAAKEALKQLPSLVDNKMMGSSEPRIADTDLSLGSPYKIYFFRADELLADKNLVDMVGTSYSQIVPVLHNGNLASAITVALNEADEWRFTSISNADFIADVIDALKAGDKVGGDGENEKFIVEIPAVRLKVVAHLEDSKLYFTHIYDNVAFQFQKHTTELAADVIQKIKPSLSNEINSFRPPS